MTVSADRTTRRGLLLGAGGSAALAALPRRARAQGRGITFAFAPDDSGAVARLIEGFTEETGIPVRWRQVDRLTDTYFRELQSDFIAGAQDIDVFGADVVWTAELAAQDRVTDMTGWLGDAFPGDAFVEAARRSTVWRNRAWAVPWYTDAGLMFYRRDLLAEAGLEPPATWDGLAEAARVVTEASGVPHGLVFQGDAYEGGVTNALEFIWSAGGRPWTGQVTVGGAFNAGQAVRDPNVVTLNSQDTVSGLARARAFVAEGIAPEAVTDMREQEALAAFMGGEAVFMRNWPFAYGIMTGAGSGLSAEQIGVAPIPVLRPEARSYSCLGGWNLAIPRGARDPDAALAFIAYATEPAQQRMMAEVGGFLPALRSLYADEGLREAVPVVALGETAVANARARPASPVYSLLSPRLAFMFEDVLAGEVEPAAAVARTQAELRRILRRFSY